MLRVILAVALISAIPAHAQRAQQPAPSTAAKLKALDDAYKAGVITKEEYEAKKRALLGGTRSQPPGNYSGPLPQPQLPPGFSVINDDAGTGRILTVQYPGGAALGQGGSARFCRLAARLF